MTAPRWPRLLLALAATLASLAGAELLSRAVAPTDFRKPPEPVPDDVWRGLLHRPSEIPGLAYELRPGREGRAQGAEVRTNAFGMRDDEPWSGTGPPPARIAILGDSFTFGFGVAADETYPNVLERRLEAELGAGAVEVLNLGVGGYSTRDEALVLRHRALAWDPGLVVVGYVLNDPEIDPIQPLHAYFQEVAWWQRSNLLRLAARVRWNRELARFGNDYVRSLHDPAGRKWRSVVESFASMAEAAGERSVPVLVAIFPMTEAKPWADYPYRDLHAQVAEAARAAGLEALDLLPAFEPVPGEALRVGPRDRHPNERAHALAAEAIRRWIAERVERIALTPG